MSTLTDIEREHYRRGQEDTLSQLFDVADDEGVVAIERAAIESGILVRCECGQANISYADDCLDCGADVA